MNTITIRYRKFLYVVGIVTFLTGIGFSVSYDLKGLWAAVGVMISAIGLFIAFSPSVRNETVLYTDK